MTTPARRTYYDLLNLSPRATTVQIEAMFRRVVARYRPTITTEQVFNDKRFQAILNAYLTLVGATRARYDAELAANPNEPYTPEPLVKLTPLERRMLLVRIAIWRREQSEALHLLRALLETQPGHAPAWALMGEVHFLIDRLEDGIRAYERAVAAAPNDTTYAARLQHARQAQAGLVELYLEPSPEEELLAEERRVRRLMMAGIGAVGLVVIAMAFLIEKQFNSSALYVPWRSVFILTLGVGILCAALAYGRVLQPFERTMIWTSMAAHSRGGERSYPYGLIVFVTAVACMWLSVVSLVIIAFMDEEWPWSATIVMGICVVLNIALTLVVSTLLPGYWAGTLLVGGNLPAIGGLLGWWAGYIGWMSLE
jgi:curved DNA-binding protein CbpA